MTRYYQNKNADLGVLFMVDILEKSFNSIHDWIMRSYGLIRYFEDLKKGSATGTI